MLNTSKTTSRAKIIPGRKKRQSKISVTQKLRVKLLPSCK
jgi:hypothetical protein